MPTLRVIDFAPAPGGRFRKDGPNSGESFRDDVLIPQLKNASVDKPLVIELDGAPGYGSSFLDEAFGGLVRSGLFTMTELKARLVVTAVSSLYEPYRSLVARYMAEAERSKTFA